MSISAVTDLLKLHALYLLSYEMAVNYTLRNPNAPIADTPRERIADQALVNPFVVLKAAGGRGAELVEEIRDLRAGLQTFGDKTAAMLVSQTSPVGV